MNPPPPLHQTLAAWANCGFEADSDTDYEQAMALMASAAVRIRSLEAALAHALTLSTGQISDDQYVCKQRLDQTNRFLRECVAGNLPAPE